MFLLIDNYDAFTFNFVQAFNELGRHPVVVRNDDPLLLEMAKNPQLSMVCISPGPGRPESSGLCLDFLKILPRHIPVLGVCLGHQILGVFSGMRVLASATVMYGKQSLVTHDKKGLFSSLPSPMTVGCYHSLHVEMEGGLGLDNVRVIARSQAGEIMALQYLDRPWAGVQFHPESVLTPEGMRLLANFPSGLLPTQDQGFVRESYRLTRKSRAPVQMSNVIEDLALGKNLSAEIAADVFARLMDGELPAAQAGALLLGLRAKGETPEEVSEAVNAVLARAITIPPIAGTTIDIVGTGGDGKESFNCSTATALTLAGMGYKVLKHGNRSVSSRCGSADVLEQLGISLDTPPEAVKEELEKEGFVFLYAPNYHPSFRNVMPVRRELGVRTLFNILGPLVNPAFPTHHLFGVPNKEQLTLVAATLARSKRGVGAVVLGAGGYDELTPTGEASIVFVNNSQMHAARIDPAEFGFLPCAEQDLSVADPQEAAEVLRKILQGNGPRPMQDMLALNLGLALYLLGAQENTKEFLDSDCGYNRLRMQAAMEEAKRAVAAGCGRRFCHA